MNQVQTLFLQAVGAALKNEAVAWEQELSREDWQALLQLAQIHRMLPMVFQALYRCPAAQRADPRLMAHYRLCAMQMVALQIHKTDEFRRVLTALEQAGVQPLVVKGIICRELYPNPDYRLSSDEDVLIPPAHFAQCHAVLTQLGYSTRDPEEDAYELSYQKEGGSLNLEIHRSLFPGESEAYGDMNRFFRQVCDHPLTERGVPSLSPTDHMLYLLCHAFKHFLHSGFGLRQVCDLILYANHHGSAIDWEYILECCCQLRAEKFAAGLFRIGWKHLGFSLEESRYPIRWQAIFVDEEPLLEDILQAGVYGAADPDRVHSSNMTIQAVTAQKQGAAPAPALLQSLFPSKGIMEAKYPYLKEKPHLLPLAWTDRILRYGKSSAKSADTLRLGNARIALLKKYGVLDE